VRRRGKERVRNGSYSDREKEKEKVKNAKRSWKDEIREEGEYTQLKTHLLRVV
jgi:hypothetical protein